MVEKNLEKITTYFVSHMLGTTLSLSDTVKTTTHSTRFSSKLMTCCDQSCKHQGSNFSQPLGFSSRTGQRRRCVSIIKINQWLYKEIIAIKALCAKNQSSLMLIYYSTLLTVVVELVVRYIHSWSAHRVCKSGNSALLQPGDKSSHQTSGYYIIRNSNTSLVLKF